MPSHGISSSTQSRSRLSDSQEQPGAAAGPADETAPTTDVKPLKGEDRAACGELTIRYVLVPLDGSPLAEGALPWAGAGARTGPLPSGAERNRGVGAPRFTPGVRAVEDHLRTELV